MSDRLVLIVSLWVHPGQEAAFEAFERDAARTMAHHGGRIDQAVRIEPDEAYAPFEVHVVSFPNPEAYGAYRSDPETAARAGLRAEIVSRTAVRIGRPSGPY